MQSKDHLSAADSVAPFGAEPVAEAVYFRRAPHEPEDYLPVLPGTARSHVRAELITRIVPLYASPSPSGSGPTDTQIWALAKRRIGFHQNRPDGRFSADNVDDVEIMSFARDVLALQSKGNQHG